MNVKNDVQISIYKDMMDLQKQLVNDILKMLPNQAVQVDNSNKVQEVKQTPPPNPEGTISKYA
ncbi:2-hydroxyacid dehydrogenase [Hydrogenivirga sp. 128-5-R1-1]|uniref:2-hydroxyacid dehydrogenase n=1 Tax=Hydrogenivirga sp. 128-5-R1-1 TaxID=392423 RepID=UPI00015F199A|nr:2-hydroxyacid dehydrogenase [Hydrogenivirga sp. 128-5-R1-1]EDP73842.1 2-hydroxyacid dehydrogenase [Hydrogenivirga sp. 128-5-R1-1]